MGPNEIFFQGSKGAFGIGIAFGIVPRSEDLLDAKRGASLHEKFRSRLAAIVADEFWRVRDFADALRKLLKDSMIQSLKPIPGFGFETEGQTHDFFGVPVKDNDQIHPAPVTELDLCHVDAPELADPVSPGLAFQGSAAV